MNTLVTLPAPAIASPPQPDKTSLLDATLQFADRHYAREDWVAARDFLTLAAQMAPDSAQVQAALGSLNYQLHDYQAAIASFATAVRLNASDPDVQTQLAMALLQNKEAGAAEAALLRALDLRPNFQTAIKLLADSKLGRRCYPEAAVLYGQLIDQHPDQVGVFLCLAKCFFGVGDREGAEAALGQVLTMDPSNEIARGNLLVLQRKTPA
jgi:tetratricopeptide (TPR) repeat protein